MLTWHAAAQPLLPPLTRATDSAERAANSEIGRAPGRQLAPQHRPAPPPRRRPRRAGAPEKSQSAPPRGLREVQTTGRAVSSRAAPVGRQQRKRERLDPSSPPGVQGVRGARPPCGPAGPLPSPLAPSAALAEPARHASSAPAGPGRAPLSRARRRAPMLGERRPAALQPCCPGAASSLRPRHS